MFAKIFALSLFTSLTAAVLTYAVFAAKLPSSFLLYVLIVVLGISLFAVGSIVRPVMEVRDALRSAIDYGVGDEIEEIKSAVERIIREFESERRDFKEKIAKLSAALNALNVWIFEVREGRIENSRFAKNLTGYADEELIGRDISEVFESFRPNSECEIVTKNGKKLTVEVSCFKDFCFAISIEDRKRLERELAFLKAILEYSVDAIVILDLDSRIVSCNRGAEMMFGYKADEMIGKPITFLLPPELHDQCRDNFKRAILEGHVKDIGSVRITKDGRRIIVDQTLTSIFEDGEVIGFVAIMRDVTKRKETEMELKRMRMELERLTKEFIRSQKELKHLASIVETSNDAIYSISIDGKITSWNKTAESLFGWKKDEIIGMDASVLLPEEIKNETELVLRRLREGECNLHFETRRVTRDGRILEVEVTVSPMFEEDELSGFSVIARRLDGAFELEKKVLRYDIERGRIYLAESIDQAADVIEDLTRCGYEGVIISRRYPEEFGIDARFYWLSEKGDVPMDADKIYDLIVNLPGWRNAVLLDIEHLIIAKGFDEVYSLIQKLRDVYYILRKGVIVVYAGELSGGEESLLRMECAKIVARSVSIPNEVFEVLRFVYTRNRIGERPSIKDVMNALGITRNTAKKRIDYLAGRGLIKIIKDGRSRLLEVTDEGREVFVRSDAI